jgi:hypothetical protein
MAAVAGVLFVVALVVGQYVAPDLVYPEEQVGGVQLTFYVTTGAAKECELSGA